MKTTHQTIQPPFHKSLDEAYPHFREIPASSTVTVITPDELDGNGQISKSGVVFSWEDYQRHYLAEGDSWFSLSDVLSPSFLYRLGDAVPLRHSTLIVNCSYPGHTLARMVDWSKNMNFPRLLSKKRFAWKWDGILLSAGGNDIIEAAMSPSGILRMCDNPASHKDFIDFNAISRLEAHLKEWFRYLLALREASPITDNCNTPIFYHTYGYTTPRNAPAAFIGPWLYRAFTQKQVPMQFWAALSDALMDALADILRGFTGIGSNIHLVDTLRYVGLVRAISGSTGSSGDWLNEIHLNNSGKDKVARYWANYL